ncbi:MAG: PAS domain-containing sensor histidine kinase [Bacteroidota bacterium]
MFTEQNIIFKDDKTFRAIFQSAVEGIIAVDETGKIIMSNPVSEKMFDYGRGDLIGLQVEQLIPSRFRPNHKKLRSNYQNAPAPRLMGKGRDLMGLKSNGGEFPIEVSLSHVTVKEKLMVVAFIIDISERKKIEDALKKSEEQLVNYATELERRVEERTDALNTSIRELEKANQALEEQIEERKRAEEEARKSLEKEKILNELKSRFVSMASHEFRTPLSTILSSASLILKYTTDETQDKREKHVNRIKSSVSNLTAILNDFLSLDKLESGKIELNFELCDPQEVLEETLEEMNLLKKPDQELVASIVKEHSDDVSIDPRIFKNIIFNLVSNAIKYSPSNKPISIGMKLDEKCIVLKVTDRGCGIPEEEQKHLFERFFRAKNVVNIQGTGLGLNIVKKYLDLMKGQITFTSELNKGTTFEVSIPINQREP